MQPFREYLEEQMDGGPVTIWDPARLHLDDLNDRESVNDELAELTSGEILHPEVSYEQVCQYLEPQGVELPAVSAHANEFLETAGELFLPLVSMNDAAHAVYLYFAWAQDETDFDYDVLAEIMSAQELEELLNETPDDEA